MHSTENKLFFFLFLVSFKLGKLCCVFVCYLLILCVSLLGNLLNVASSDGYHVQEGERHQQRTSMFSQVTKFAHDDADDVFSVYYLQDVLFKKQNKKNYENKI